jgi:adenylate cyclase
MTEQRKLAAVMFTDIVGYTSLMSKDEHKALQLLQKNRDMQKSLGKKHHGEFLKEMGDGTLLCFQSALDAVYSAIEIQRTVRNDPDLKLRIGIHLGDIVFKDRDVFGDGVNVASRIEGLAETGGICFSEQIYKTVRNQPGIQVEDLGEKTLKNVAHPIHIYKLTEQSLLYQPKTTPSEDSMKTSEKDRYGLRIFRKKYIRFGFAAIILILIILSGLFLLKRKKKSALVFPTKMLVVLPFENLGPEEDAYFAEGITDAITARLAKLHGLGVISRQSAIQYRNSEKNANLIGMELGVDYILEGTIQRERPGDPKSKVRVIPQLIIVDDDTHIWAETLDREMNQIFQVQTEIAERIAQELDVKLLDPERKLLEAQSTKSIEAYDYYLLGNEYLNKGWAEPDLSKAIEFYQKATGADTSFALAYAQLCGAHLRVYQEYHDRSTDRLRLAKTNIDMALELNPDLTEAHHNLGLYYYWLGDYNLARKQFERALKGQPSNSDLICSIAFVLRRHGKLEDAITHLARAVELDPHDHIKWYELAMTQLVNHDYRDAERAFNQVIFQKSEWYVPYLFKSILFLSRSGDTVRANLVMSEAIRRIGLKKLVKNLVFAGGADVFSYLDDTFLDALNTMTINDLEGDSLSLFLAKIVLHERRSDADKKKAYTDSSRVILERLVMAQPSEAWFHAELGLCYARLGMNVLAVDHGKKAIDLAPVSEDIWSGTDYLWFLASIYMELKEYEKAIEQVRIAFKYPSMISREWLRIDKEWKPLLDYPDFQDILNQK